MADEGTIYGIIFLGFLAWTIIWSPMVIKLWNLLKVYYLDINKIWAVSLNGNNGLGTIKKVKPTPDGIKAAKQAGGYEVPTELNFMFKDRVAGNPIVVYDEDTGLPLRPYSGEIEMGDPAVNRSREIGKAIDNMQRNGGVNLLAIVIVLGVVVIVGFIIMGLMINGVKS